jgi:hypothetical protein
MCLQQTFGCDALGLLKCPQPTHINQDVPIVNPLSIVENFEKYSLRGSNMTL